MNVGISIMRKAIYVCPLLCLYINTFRQEYSFIISIYFTYNCFNVYNYLFLVKPANCLNLLERGHTTSDIFSIYPCDECDEKFQSMAVTCDMETSGGGWTVRLIDCNFLFIYFFVNKKIAMTNISEFTLRICFIRNTYLT